MKDYLPDYYRDSRQMNAIMDVEGNELDTLEDTTKDVENQLTIQKATWKISTYEEIFAVASEAGADLEQRRAKLLSKIRLRSPTTKREFIRFLQPFAETVEITEYYSEYLVKFNFLGLKVGFNTISDVLYTTLPAHLARLMETKNEKKLSLYCGIALNQGGTKKIGIALPEKASISAQYGSAISVSGKRTINVALPTGLRTGLFIGSTFNIGGKIVIGVRGGT
jgi:hypothetical protein